MMLKVLIVEFDLFTATGGGQTFYRSLIRANPNANFYFLSRKVGRPSVTGLPNAQAVPFHTHYPEEARGDSAETFRLQNMQRAMNIAVSVADFSFDIVDYPDYSTCGAYLRPAFLQHKISFGKMVLSLHGIISDQRRAHWWPAEKKDESLASVVELELRQYQTADIRYGISRRYLRRWKEMTGWNTIPCGSFFRPWKPRVRFPRMFNNNRRWFLSGVRKSTRAPI
jgi:hypothetical protein